MKNGNTEMPSAQLPNEIWIAIFKHFDITCLLDLSLVCKHWNHLIFTHLANRIMLNLDLDQRKYPPRDIGMVPERYYKHLCLRSFKLDSPAYLFEIVKQLAVHLDTLELTLVSLECQDLLQLLALCTRMTKLCIKAKYFECDDTMHSSIPILYAVRSLSFDVENYVSTFNLYSFEMSFLRTMPNVNELKTLLYRPLDLSMILWMSARLKVLKATVSCEAINDFLSLRLPALKVLDLTLLQPEHQWRKRRTFHARAFQDFLLGCKSLKTALLSFRCEYDQQLLTAIFTSLSRVEVLQLSGGLATERFSLNGMERMTCLKTLSLHCLLLFQEDDRVVPMRTVEKFSMCTFIRPNKFGDILKRFPNLKSLAFRMHGDELQSVAEVVPLLEELSVDISRITPEMINHMQQLVTLKKLTIDAHSIARTNFRLLRNIKALPAMKCLNVSTGSNIPPNIASSIAATNQACKLILNGQLVKPATRTRRSGVKRKQTATVSTPNRKSASKSTSPTPTDESHPSESGASTSGSGSFLASSLDNSNVSFSMVKCSSPGESALVRINQSMDEGESASGGLEESTDGAFSSAASTIEVQNNSENQVMVNHLSPNNSMTSK
ncbi:uncharacterized protein LOC135702716 [Ochlerotatus camptorhynchus]|uniref:uncharacterized protein LOC135702716 n=1 Tax=Ochlerotatus camptorhynchus TaxID=644619 RepID=UPI0031D74BEB